jgi:hypothetical protein
VSFRAILHFKEADMTRTQTNDPAQSTALQRAVQSYFRSVPGSGPVSTAEAIRSIRAEVPDCDLANGDLADIVARRAIWHGYDVSFDGEGGDGRA